MFSDRVHNDREMCDFRGVPDDGEMMEGVVAELSIKALADYKARISLDQLDAEHRAALITAVNNVLSTELAVFTYAQIIDDLPTGDVAYDTRYHGTFVPDDHPIDLDHDEVCPGTMEKAREWCGSWDPDTLKFNPNVLNAFQMATPGSKLYNTRLIELVTTVLHQFGAQLFQLELFLHKGGREAVQKARNWEQPGPKPSWADESWVAKQAFWPFFHQPFYLNKEMYPEEDADIVGYWAESHIFGGVAVFDRQFEECNGPDSTYSQPYPPNVFFHPNGRELTNRIAQLRDNQQEKLVDFLLLEDVGNVAALSPLPILVDIHDKNRLDSELSITVHRVFRDIWERKPATEWVIHIRARRPMCGIDYCWTAGLTGRLKMVEGVPVQLFVVEKIDAKPDRKEKTEIVKKAKL